MGTIVEKNAHSFLQAFTACHFRKLHADETIYTCNGLTSVRGFISPPHIQAFFTSLGCIVSVPFDHPVLSVFVSVTDSVRQSAAVSVCVGEQAIVHTDSNLLLNIYCVCLDVSNLPDWDKLQATEAVMWPQLYCSFFFNVDASFPKLKSKFVYLILQILRNDSPTTFSCSSFASGTWNSLHGSQVMICFSSGCSSKDFCFMK